MDPKIAAGPLALVHFSALIFKYFAFALREGPLETLHHV
jgi:hypothetical protein